MKKIYILAITLFSVVFSAGAWSSNLDKGALLLASKNLNPETRSLLTTYIGKDHSKPAGHLRWHRRNGRLLHTEGWHILHLDAQNLPSAKDENDAFVQIEKALEVVRNRSQYEKAEVSLAIQTVMNLVLDMHNLSNVALEEYPLSGTDFDFIFQKNGILGRKGTATPSSWKVLWTHRFVTYHAAYSPVMWVEEMEVMYGAKKSEFSAGTLRDWAVDIGAYSKPIYEHLKQNNNHFHFAKVHECDMFHMSCVAKAAYRLAVLLNENLK